MPVQSSHAERGARAKSWRQPMPWHRALQHFSKTLWKCSIHWLPLRLCYGTSLLTKILWTRIVFIWKPCYDTYCSMIINEIQYLPHRFSRVRTRPGMIVERVTVAMLACLKMVNCLQVQVSGLPGLSHWARYRLQLADFFLHC